MFSYLQAGIVVAATLLTPPSVEPKEYPALWQNTGEGRTYVLYRKFQSTAMSQGQVGSCVGCAFAKAMHMLDGKDYSVEWVYGKSRDYFGKTYGAGSQCGWACQMAQDIGLIEAKRYAILGFDLSSYDPALAYSWERGPPEILEWSAAKNRTRGFVRITTWEQLRDAIATGHPVVVGSRVGFGSRTNAVRTRDGMLRSRWYSRWSHAMVICGVSDGKSKRALLLNSWGTNWIRGPKWLGDEPDGSFWISKRDAEKILSYGDSYAVLPVVK